MAKRTIRGGVVLSNASIESSFTVRVYQGRFTVATFTARTATCGEAVALGFKRAEANLKSSRAIWPERGFKESDYAVTVQSCCIQLGDESQVTRRGFPKESGE